MLNHLIDLYRHQHWADAEHWRALKSYQEALDDPRVFERLHHIHQVQRAFLCLAQGVPVEVTQPADYDATTLEAWARAYHEEAIPFVETLDESRLAVLVHIPWFAEPKLEIPLSEALTQAAMHSQYHRGQNATRLREMGSTPPNTDYIIWLWKGRPEPSWK